MDNIEFYRNKFYRLLESKLGDVKPLVTEQGYSWANSGTQTSTTTTKAEPLPTVTTYGSGGNVDVESRNWCLQNNITKGQCTKEFCKSYPNKCKTSPTEQAYDVLLTTASILSSFIPVIGPAVSLLFTGMDTYNKASQGEKPDTISLLLGLVPGIGKITTKIPGVKQLGSTGMKTLADKLKKSGSKAVLSDAEKGVLQSLSKEKDFVTQELNNHIKSLATNKINVTKDPKIKETLKKVAKEGLYTAAEEVAVNSLNSLTTVK